MNNAELIKVLRKCGKQSPDRCWDCEYYDRDPWCESALVNDAADALEADEKRINELTTKCNQLQAEVDNYEKRIAELEAQMPKEGEWKKILQNGDGTSDYECSACLGIIMDVPDDDEHPLCSFCPNCGAKMKGANDE